MFQLILSNGNFTGNLSQLVSVWIQLIHSRSYTCIIYWDSEAIFIAPTERKRGRYHSYLKLKKDTWLVSSCALTRLTLTFCFFILSIVCFVFVIKTLHPSVKETSVVKHDFDILTMYKVWAKSVTQISRISLWRLDASSGAKLLNIQLNRPSIWNYLELHLRNYSKNSTRKFTHRWHFRERNRFQQISVIKKERKNKLEQLGHIAFFATSIFVLLQWILQVHEVLLIP